MRRLIFIGIVMVTLTVSAQTTSTYGDLRAKLLHVGQQFTGRNTVNDQAIAVVLRELANNYQGHLSRQQFRELRDTIEGMRSRISAETWRTALSNAVKTLQEKTDTLDIQQCILDYYKRVPQEQIYVHTDKPYYVPGDTVWFRAHLVDAVTHTPISRSRYVYVELHDQQADTLVQRLIVKCDSDGVFANALVLPHDMHGGSYTLAAYTQWMRNFPAERFFYKELLVVGNKSSQKTKSVPFGLPVRPLRTQSPLPMDSGLELGQRKGQLLIQLNKVTDAPLACVLYGSGNLLVADYTQGKVLRIDSQTLRPGNLSVAIVNCETGRVIAEKQTTIEGSQLQIAISGKARTQNEPMELDIRMVCDDGTPLSGNFSLSVTDYDVVTPDTIQPTIDKYLDQQSADYPLADMLNGTYTQQNISPHRLWFPDHTDHYRADSWYYLQKNQESQADVGTARYRIPSDLRTWRQLPLYHQRPRLRRRYDLRTGRYATYRQYQSRTTEYRPTDIPYLTFAFLLCHINSFRPRQLRKAGSRAGDVWQRTSPPICWVSCPSVLFMMTTPCSTISTRWRFCSVP